jgi:hypothetical protein
VLDKEASNFCDYFSPGAGTGGPFLKTGEDAKSKLENLFRKKS